MIVPRITTRGYYDRTTGRPRKHKRYSLYPRNLHDMMEGADEICIMVHGMRNDSAGAAAKTLLAAGRLATLGYDHPVIGFSYDSDIPGAHRDADYTRVHHIAGRIAAGNGWNLASFVSDYIWSTKSRVRLLGHSLGSEVILSALDTLHGSGTRIEAVYLFAASAGQERLSESLDVISDTITRSLTNYYCPHDEVLSEGHRRGVRPYPVGLYGTGDVDGCSNIEVEAANHRFASYAETIESFP